MSKVIEITSCKQHDNIIDNNDKVVIFFGYSGCGACMVSKPIFDDLSLKYPNITFAHVESSKLQCVNIDDGVPQFIFYKNQQPIEQVLGMREDMMDDILKSL